MKIHFQVVTTTRYSNPSKNDLLDSFNRHYDHHPAYVAFRIETGQTIHVRISALTYESGANHMLLFQGSTPERKMVKGFYNSNTRSGHLEIEG